MNSLFRRAALIAAGLLATAAQAQDYPSRPLRLIVPFVPGGSSDFGFWARIVKNVGATAE